MVFSEFPIFRTMLPWQRHRAHTHHLQNCKQPDSESLGSHLTKKHYEQMCLRGGRVSVIGPWTISNDRGYRTAHGSAKTLLVDLASEHKVSGCQNKFQ